MNKSCRHVFFPLFNVVRSCRVLAAALPKHRSRPPSRRSRPTLRPITSRAHTALPHGPPGFCYTDYPKGETVPFLRLSGRWLEQRGFGIGIQVYVEAAEGRLILTNYKTHMAELFGSSE